MGSSTGGSVPRIMVFRPTLEEMKDFSGYIAKMESQGAHKAGLAKVIPPKEWIPRKNGYDNIEMTIPSPIEQLVHGRQGLYQQFNMQKKSMKVADFRKLAETTRYRTPEHFDYEDLERKYWKNICFNPPIYGADVSGSLYDPGVDEFNINHLNTILDLVGNDYGIKIEGVNTAYLYFGMWKTTFPWHTEDMDLYSINYLHFGAPKSWYAIPPEHGRRVERLATGFFPGSFQSCSAFLRHKMTLISPQILKQYSIPFNKITQEPGEFMITFPFGYHAGFNHGFNCAESTNFASERWIEYGKRALQCTCRKDGVKIGMDVFVRNFQPDRYELWRIGKDVGPHPEDPNRCTAAPPPSKAELSFYKSEGKRQYKTDLPPNQFSKRHPIIKGMGVQMNCPDSSSDESSSEESSSSSSDSSASSSSSDTEVYTHDDTASGVMKLKKKKRKNKDFDYSALKKVKCENPSSLDMNACVVALDNIKKTADELNSKCPPTLKPFFAGDEQTVTATNQVNKEHGYSSLVSQEGPLRLIISKQGAASVEALKTKSECDKGKSLASLLPLQHAAIEKCKQRASLNIATTSKVQVEPGSPSGSKDKLPMAHKEKTFRPKSSSVTNQSQPMMYFPAPSATPQSTGNFFCNPLTLNSGSPYPVESSVQQSHAVIAKDHHLTPSHVSSLDVISHGAAVKAVSTVSRSSRESSIDTFPDDQSMVEDIYDTFLDDEAKKMNLANANSFITDIKESKNSNYLTDDLPLREPSNYAINRNVINPSQENATDKAVKNPDFLRDLTSSPVKKSPQKPQWIENRRFPTAKRHKTVKSPTSDIAQKSDAGTNESTDSGSDSDETVTSRSDSDNSDQEDDLTNSPSWAQPLNYLWQHKNSSFEKIRAYNAKRALIPPHCSICSVFKSYASVDNSVETRLPENSQVFMPGSLFAEKSAEPGAILDGTSFSECNGNSPLLQCFHCKVCVHAVCYGVTFEPSGSWLCDRCDEDDTHANCALCPLKGGALKRANEVGVWVHILCAVLTPNIVFIDVRKKSPIDLADLSAKQQNLTCFYCSMIYKPQPNAKKKICVQCTSGKCNRSFHITCGHAAGVTFELSDWPATISIHCTRHPRLGSKEEERDLCPVNVGDSVLAKYHNGRYYECDVTTVESVKYLTVDFEDGSFSENLLPEDIVEREKKGKTKKPPKIGECIKVKWTDKKVYRAIFKGERVETTYTVEFEDGCEKQLQREAFYSRNEKLPKRIQSKVSKATERRHDDLFQDNYSNKYRKKVNKNKRKPTSRSIKSC